MTEKKTLGSMANVWKALLELDPTLDVGLSPIDVGQAMIMLTNLLLKDIQKSILVLFNIRQRSMTQDSSSHLP